MHTFSRRSLLGALAGATVLRAQAGDWVSLFDGRSLAGWKANESPGSWKVADGCIVAAGPRSHLFYQGPVRGGRFRNFEFETEVLARPGSNSGIFFHTEFQESGWPAKGFEVQVDNTHKGEGGYIERKRTGSLYAVRNQYKSLVRDDDWFRLNFVVRGKNVRVHVNGVLVTDYTESDPPLVTSGGEGRVFGSGLLALQAHDPKSTVLYRNLRIRPLADDAVAPGARPGATDATAVELLRLGAANYPLVDYHTHLKGALTLEKALAKSRETGIYCGIAINCGKGHAVEDDAGARAFVESLRGVPAFAAMQAEGREWTQMFSRPTAALFDYIFTDSMTWSDNRGRRMRLWIAREVGEITDVNEFMETFVDRTVGILQREPVDIYVNPTFLPDQIASRYDELWTEERMRRVIRAAKSNDVALELNDRYRLPGEKFVRMAKEEGLKFSFGTNNAGAEDWGRSEYGLAMIKACGLRWQDFFVPKPRGERAVDLRGSMLRA